MQSTLTILYRLPNGDESIWPGAASVHRYCERNGDTDPGVLVSFPDGTSTHFGVPDARQVGAPLPTVFVMNEHGKTVAKYEL